MIGAGPPNGYLEAALDLFDEFGPAAPSLALGVDAFAA